MIGAKLIDNYGCCTTRSLVQTDTGIHNPTSVNALRYASKVSDRPYPGGQLNAGWKEDWVSQSSGQFDAFLITYECNV